MKIGSVDAKVSLLAMAVVGIFALFLIFRFITSADWYVLAWGIPMLCLLVVIPLGLNYMSQKQYADLVPIYEKEAKPLRVRAITIHQLGQPVRVQGVVERVYFQFLNRPQYLVADKSGEISVKMFTNPAVKIQKGDVVEVLGTVMKRYIFTGDAVINCVSIRHLKTGKNGP